MLPGTGEPADPATIATSYFILAPVLANGWSYLGEPSKFVAVSARRLLTVHPREGTAGLTARLLVASGEILHAVVQSPDRRVHEVECRAEADRQVRKTSSHRQVRRPPNWPRSWANSSLSQQYSHRNAWANLYILGQPNTFLAAGALRGGRVRERAAADLLAAWLHLRGGSGWRDGRAQEPLFPSWTRF